MINKHTKAERTRNLRYKRPALASMGYLPQYWERLKDLQRRTCRPMKGEGKSVFDLEARFIFEDERDVAGLSITDRDFFLR